MTYTRLWTATFIIAVVILAGFFLSVPRTREVLEPARPIASSTQSVTLRDVYKKGIHTISGSVITPDACTSVLAQASLASSTGTSAPPHIEVDLSFPADTDICLMVPTSVHFSTTVAAPANAIVTVRINGGIATTSAP